MDQPSLFDYAKEPEAPRPPNIEFIRHTLSGLLRKTRNAVTLPWHPVDARSWEREFPILVKYLPPEEGEEMLAAFEKEMARVWAAYNERLAG